MSARRCLGLIPGRATASPPPLAGEREGGMQRTPSPMASPSPTLPRKRERERAGANGYGGDSQ
jgi:hypothetical protein